MSYIGDDYAGLFGALRRRCPNIKLDPRPGNYYVSIRDGRKAGLLAGPYPWHAQAARDVPRVRRIAKEVNPREAAFAGFGTARSEKDRGPGLLNRLGEI